MRAGQVWGLGWSDDFFDVDGYDRDTCVRHFSLLVEAGLVAAPGTQGVKHFNITGLTLEGHEFLDSVRDAGIWKKTKEGAAKVGGWTVPIISELAKGYVKAKARKLGLPL